MGKHLQTWVDEFIPYYGGPDCTKKKVFVWCEVYGWHQGCFNIMKPKG